MTLGFHTFIAQQIHLYEQRDWLILKHRKGALGAPKEKKKKNATQNTHPDVLSQMGTYMSIKEPEDDGVYSEAEKQSHNLIDFSDTTGSQVYDNRAGVFGLLFLFSTVCVRVNLTWCCAVQWRMLYVTFCEDLDWIAHSYQYDAMFYDDDDDDDDRFFI